MAYAECLLAQLDVTTAREVLAKAMERIRKQADTIDKPEWRQSFLTRIPEHRRTIELGRELGIADTDRFV